jgi:cathepsin L
MKTRLWPLFATAGLLLSVATSSDVDAQPIQLRPPTPPPTVSFAQRELTAPLAIKTQLSQLRKEITAKGMTHTVGYTTALDRTLADLTGLVVPPDAARQAAAQAPIQARLLRADVDHRSQFARRFPNLRIIPPPQPPFTASAARADWRAEGKVSPIDDQGYCGSCWAFAAMGAYEASYMIQNGTTVDGSKQSVLSCSNAGSCKGGWTAPALNWLLTSGATTETAYPYTGTSGGCQTFTHDLKAAAWGYIRPDGTVATTAEMKDAIVTYGPIVVALYASSQFKAYTGGVFFEQVGAGALNHGVVLVGWDDTVVGPNNAKGAWILRNSWGTYWGTTADQGTERGYMYLGYGSSNVGIWSQWVRAANATTGVSPQVGAIVAQ